MALLARLLDSLEKQTLAPTAYEVIIVHNHTPDGTEEMAKAWCLRQPFRARYYRKNYAGPARSRHFGAQNAEGCFIAFIDDDCVATPDWLKAGLASFKKSQEQANDSAVVPSQRVGLVQGKTIPLPNQDQTFPFKTVRVDGPTAFFETCNIFYLREAFDAVGGFSPDFLDSFGGEDSDLGWKVATYGYHTSFAEDALVHHEVFRITMRKWLAEPFYYKILPRLVKKHPAIRKHMYLRYFLNPDTCLFNLFVLSIPVAVASPGAGAALAAVYFVLRYKTGAHVGTFRHRIGRLLVGLIRAPYMWWSLVIGSIRARCVLL